MEHGLSKFLNYRVSRVLPIILFGTLFACSTTSLPLERHTISAVTIIYADIDTINLAARGRGYTDVKSVRGFYDPKRNELWCPNDTTSDAFETCGHELRHLTKGPFH